jgi:hypothetical protein
MAQRIKAREVPLGPRPLSRECVAFAHFHPDAPIERVAGRANLLRTNHQNIPSHFSHFSPLSHFSLLRMEAGGFYAASQVTLTHPGARCREAR